MYHSCIPAHCIPDHHLNSIFIFCKFHAQSDCFGADPFVFHTVIPQYDAEFTLLFLTVYSFQLKGSDRFLIHKYPEMFIIVPVTVVVVYIGPGNLLILIAEGGGIHHRIRFITPEKCMVFFFGKGPQFNPVQA